MKQLTLNDPKPLGDKDPKYGQTYWSYTHDQEHPVMFNLMEGEVYDGSVIAAETVELKTSSKGTDYHRLKKVKVIGQHSEPQLPTPPPDSSKLLSLIYDDTQKILRLVGHKDNEQLLERQPTLASTWRKTTGQEDTVTYDIGDEPINIEDIPF